jgi:basic membrane lipoprotein Med (substrate-binding protein (PBP1-ABC) superfamily)
VRYVVAGATVTALVAGVVTWALWPEQPRQREYLNATACLLTGENGILDEPAASTWAVLQEASVATLVQVQYLPVLGPQTTENATAYLASLTTGQCGVIIATGKPQTDAVTAGAATYTDRRFMTVGDGTPAPNLQVVAPESVRASLTESIQELADRAS